MSAPARAVYPWPVASPTLDEKRKLLAAVPFFGGLSEKELAGLTQVARTQSLPPRRELFHKGDEGTEVYVVIHGSLKALTTSEEGDDVVFTILGPGELFGEIAFLGNTMRTATVTALTDCELLAIDRRDFMAFLKSHPEAAIKLLSVLAKRLKQVSELVEDTIFLNLPVRLAKKLVHYAAIYGEKSKAGEVRIGLKLSQEEWGDLVGATRESINKQMRAWTEEGLISMDHGYVVIHHPETLEQLAGCVVA